jgi:hypothetical protein
MRVENYVFAAVVWAKNPVFGTGLHAPLSPYLKGYRPVVYTNEKGLTYARYIQQAKTLENILLVGFAEMGTLFSVAYIILVAITVKNMFIHAKTHPGKRLQAVLLLAPLVGFFVHSMTFDSIIYPHLNWLAHSLLGMAANFSKT